MIEYCCGAAGISYAACVTGVPYLIGNVVVNASDVEVLAFFEDVFCIFRTIPHISEKMLASTLDYLVVEELLARRVFGSVPPKVDYALTPIARSFLREISYVVEWGQLHFEEMMAARNRSKNTSSDKEIPRREARGHLSGDLCKCLEGGEIIHPFPS